MPVIYNFYSSDVLAAFLAFSKNGQAVTGSATQIIYTKGDLELKDVQSPATNTVSTNLIFQLEDNNAGIVSIAQTLNTLPNRVIPPIVFPAGTKITVVQA